MAGGDRRVVVTGLGMVTALGLTVKDNWEKALAGTSGISRVSLDHARHCPVQGVGAVRADDWRAIETAFAEYARDEGERRTLFALWAAREAVTDAGIEEMAAAGDRAGVMLAAGLGINRLEDVRRWIGERGEFGVVSFGSELDDIHRESLMRHHSHRPAALIARHFGLRGMNNTITSACAAATQAIGIAYRAVRRGDADLMLAGGADSMINPVGLVFFVLLGAASTAREGIESACRPFDRKRSGLVMGEGAGIAVLEEESHAMRRGARIYAEVAGYGSSMDAFQVTAPHPSGRGAAQSMSAALRNAGMGVEEVDYINAHGTSTKLNDFTETLAIKQVFGTHAARLAVSSSKSLIGHLLAASGGPEFGYTVLSVCRDAIHPTINLTSPDPKCDLDYVPLVRKDCVVRAAISNSFGFGGQNASIAIRKYKGEG